MRLCEQGLELYATGQLRIRLDRPADVVAFGERVGAGDLGLAEELIGSYEQRFDATVSPLPQAPDEAVAQEWLLAVRRQYWTGVG